MRALCIDPGSERSALVWVDVGEKRLTPPWGLYPVRGIERGNADVVRRMPWSEPPPFGAERRDGEEWFDVFVVEVIPSIFGGAGSTDQLKTERWAGRMMQWSGLPDGRIVEVVRASSKAAVTGSTKVGDPEVRRALIDAYGGDVAAFGKRCKCGGRRKSPCTGCNGSGWISPPGPLAGWTGSHLFAALALAFAAFRPGGVAEHLRP